MRSATLVFFRLCGSSRKNSFSAPRIEERNSRGVEIGDVSRNESQGMDFSSGREECVHHADGLADGGTSAHDASPNLGDGGFNDEKAALNAQRFGDASWADVPPSASPS